MQRKNEARRLDILRAAARVFRRLGLSATGMREIAEEADLSPGNLYYYFRRLRAVMSAHVRCMLDELEGATAHLEVEVLPEAMRKGVIQKRDAYERAVRGLVAEGIERGEFARTDPALVTRAMLGAVNWTARWYRPEGPRSVAEIADSLSDYLVRGLVPTK